MTANGNARTVQGNSVLEAQIASLLQRLDRHRERRCREILEAAESKARTLEREAWHEAAERGRTAIADARSRLDAARNQAQAQLDAARRQQAQAEAHARLDELWRLLPAAIAALWRTPGQRQRWLQSALRLADATLVARRWRVECARGSSRQELDQAIEQLGLGGQVAVDVVELSDLESGLRILADGACVDATTHGVLADARGIEAAFLAACESGPPTAAAGPPGESR